jgi:hypothetical protein
MNSLDENSSRASSDSRALVCIVEQVRHGLLFTVEGFPIGFHSLLETTTPTTKSPSV